MSDLKGMVIKLVAKQVFAFVEIEGKILKDVDMVYYSQIFQHRSRGLPKK